MTCRAVGLNRSTCRYQPRGEGEGEEARLREQVVALAHEHHRYGYRRITVLLCRQGRRINPKPGHPWQNGYVESFIGKFRDECLNEEVS
ncbi:MAG: integrase core domain-containing protein [Chloroflexota bacterium]